MTTSPHPERLSPGRHGPLADAIIALAETPEHASGVEERLATIAALESGRPVGVPDIAATTMEWPGFHKVAPALGLRASVSVPLYNGRAPTTPTPICVHEPQRTAPH